MQGSYDVDGKEASCYGKRPVYGENHEGYEDLKSHQQYTLQAICPFLLDEHIVENAYAVPECERASMYEATQCKAQGELETDTCTGSARLFEDTIAGEAADDWGAELHNRTKEATAVKATLFQDLVQEHTGRLDTASSMMPKAETAFVDHQPAEGTAEGAVAKVFGAAASTTKLQIKALIEVMETLRDRNKAKQIELSKDLYCSHVADHSYNRCRSRTSFDTASQCAVCQQVSVPAECWEAWTKWNDVSTAFHNEHNGVAETLCKVAGGKICDAGEMIATVGLAQNEFLHAQTDAKLDELHAEVFRVLFGMLSYFRVLQSCPNSDLS